MTPPTESVAPGSLVELRLIYQSGESETITLSIVPDKLADYRNGFLGEGTPLALAIMGQQPRAKIPYQVGDMAAIEIVSVKPSEGEADQGVARRREATLRKALLRSDLTNAVIFATSFDSKWGDYDPSKLVEELEDQAQDSASDEEPGQKDP